MQGSYIFPRDQITPGENITPFSGPKIVTLHTPPVNICIKQMGLSCSLFITLWLHVLSQDVWDIANES